MFVARPVIHVIQKEVPISPSPLSASLCTTALTLEASSPTELCKILFATSSPASADSTTTGRMSAMRAQDWSSYVQLP